MLAVSKFTYLNSLLEGEAKAAIKGLSLTAEHYAEAVVILKKRFGRKEKIIFSHVQELISLSTSGKQNSLSSLRQLQDRLLSHVRSLDCLGISSSQFGVILTPIVLSVLPQDVRMEWTRDSSGKESDLEYLLEFLDNEIKRREISHTFQDLKHAQKKFEERKSKICVSKNKKTTTSLASVSLADKVSTETGRGKPKSNRLSFFLWYDSPYLEMFQFS